MIWKIAKWLYYGGMFLIGWRIGKFIAQRIIIPPIDFLTGGRYGRWLERSGLRD